MTNRTRHTAQRQKTVRMYWRLSNNSATSTYTVHISTLGSTASYRGNKTKQTNQTNQQTEKKRGNFKKAGKFPFKSPFRQDYLDMNNGEKT